MNANSIYGNDRPLLSRYKSDIGLRQSKQFSIDSRIVIIGLVFSLRYFSFCEEDEPKKKKHKSILPNLHN